MRFFRVIDTPIGPLTLTEKDGFLTEVRFGRCVRPEAEAQTPLLLRSACELDEYFRGDRRTFTIPLAPKGSCFDQKCWQALQEIPYGETRSYQQQAQKIGNARACRAVGMANHRNPLPVFIPCHRVVRKDGAPGGYAGGTAAKEMLLSLERMIDE